MHKRFDNVIFDLDGTLLNSKPGVVKSLISMTKQLNLPQIPEQDYYRFIGFPIEQSVREYYGIDEKKVTDAAAAFRKTYAEKFLFDAVLYDGVQNVLTELARNNIRLAIATYKSQLYLQDIIKHFQLDEYCHPIIGSAPDSLSTKVAIVNACIKDMSANTKRTVYIGDTENDRTSALECGVDFIGATYGYGYSKNQCPPPFANEPVELVNMILK